MVTWSKTAEPRLWKLGKSSEGIDGIWVTLDAYSERAPALRPIADVAKSLVLSEQARRSMRQANARADGGDAESYSAY